MARASAVVAAVGIPALLGAAVVLAFYGETGSHWTTVVRPMLVVALLGASFSLAVQLTVRKPSWGAVSGSLGVSFGLGDHLLGWVIVELVLVWLTVQQWRHINRWTLLAAPLPQVSTFMGFVLAIVIAGLWTGGAVAPEDSYIRKGSSTTATRELPNILVLLLDGYPRADTLEQDFGVSVEPFLSDLDQIGFMIYPDATSDYRRTEQSLISMLSNLEPHDLDSISYADWPAIVDTWRQVRRDYFDDLPAIEALRDAGYHLSYIPSPIGHTDLPGWDERLDTGQLNGFEVAMIQRSLAGPLLSEWVLDQHRHRIEDSLEEWTAQAYAGGQRAVLVHLMAPHPPFVYRSDGSPQRQLSCWSLRWCSIYQSGFGELHLTEAEYGQMLGEQIAYLNSLVLRAVERVVATDPKAIVVLLSDHGGRFSDAPGPEWHRTFLAARIPGDPDALARDPGPDRLFLRLLAAAQSQQ